jgi:pimeloyl-ACP methyl ester carboxylesterase
LQTPWSFMTTEEQKVLGDFLAAGRLTLDAISGLSDIAEGLHHSVVTVGGMIGGDDADPDDKNVQRNKRTKGISGLVYRSIRQVTGLLGLGLDVLISRLTHKVTDNHSAPGRAAVVSVLNGVLGDHLQRKANPLAISMAFCQDGKALSPAELKVLLTDKPRIAIFVHGLCMNDQQWTRKGHNHGEALADELGFWPLYLRYNTGLHTSENGRALADLLDLLSHCGQPNTEFYIVAHSMGGLVSRSACYYGDTQGQHWPAQLQKVLFLGTPHHGAVLERGGNWIDVLLDSNPYSSPFSRLAQIRSSGITDLRYGNVVDEDWNSGDRFDMTGDTRVPTSLPQGVDCYAIAATTSVQAHPIVNRVVGDGLVAVGSALGQHSDPLFDLGIKPERQWLGRGINHLDLLNDPEAYTALKSFIKMPKSVSE